MVVGCSSSSPISRIKFLNPITSRPQRNDSVSSAEQSRAEQSRATGQTHPSREWRLSHFQRSYLPGDQEKTSQPVPLTNKHPNPKKKPKTKAFFDLFEPTSSPPTCDMPEQLPHHRLDRPNPSPLAHAAAAPAASPGCIRGAPCRSTPPTSALNRTFCPHTPYPISGQLTTAFEPLPLPSTVLHCRATRYWVSERKG
jgi:hypothetical protein